MNPLPALAAAASEKATQSGPTLAVSDLRISAKRDRKSIELLRGVSFHVASGETLALVGESGCGKSITSLAVMGLLAPGLSMSGEVALTNAGGRIDLVALSAAERRKLCGRRLGMIFQEPMTSLNPMQRVGDQIAETLTTHGICSREEAARRAVAMLDRMGIADPGRRALALPHELSGGMRQRVMIAMAMIGEPDLLIADEPTTALDVTVQAQILELIRDLSRERGMATLFISHDLAVVADIADRVAVMYAGEIVETGPIDQVLDAPLHPYTIGLIASRPALSTERRARLSAIFGAVPEPGRRPQGCNFHPRCSLAKPGLCDVGDVPLKRFDGRDVRCLRVGERVEA
jgi:oligopeptide/dipeptide ABC transporter ATP-binding protein